MNNCLTFIITILLVLLFSLSSSFQIISNARTNRRMFQRRMFNTDSPKDNPTTQSTMKLVSEESLLKQQEELKKVEEKSTTDVSESNNNNPLKKFDISSILTYGLYGYIGYLTVDTIRIIFFNNPISPTN